MMSCRAKVLTIVSFGASAAFVIGIRGWVNDLFLFGKGSEKAIARVVSPDGRRTAVVFETNGGATTSFGYPVRIDGEEAAMAYGATTGGKSGVRARWLDARTLEVAFDHARFTRIGSIEGLRVVVKGKLHED